MAGDTSYLSAIKDNDQGCCYEQKWTKETFCDSCIADINAKQHYFRKWIRKD